MTIWVCPDCGTEHEAKEGLEPGCQVCFRPESSTGHDEVTPPMRRAVRWNVSGERLVVGADEHGRAGLFVVTTAEQWRPFNMRDLEDCRQALGAEVGEALLVSLYRSE